MAEKVFDTRILLKYDSYASWLTNNPVLKKGEVAIATIPSVQDGVVNAPSVLIKVGDGTSTYKALQFVSGLAADVYSWAKAENKPSYDADEISGMDAYIAKYVNEQMGIEVDTDTLYQLVKVDNYNYKLQSKGKNDSAWADVANSSISIPDHSGAISMLQSLVGDSDVATQIADAINMALKVGDVEKYALASDIAGVDSRIDAIESKAGTWDTVTNKIDASSVSAIGKSGNIADAIQTAGDVIIFDCGNSVIAAK